MRAIRIESDAIGAFIIKHLGTVTCRLGKNRVGLNGGRMRHILLANRNESLGPFNRYSYMTHFSFACKGLWDGKKCRNVDAIRTYRKPLEADASCFQIEDVRCQT